MVNVESVLGFLNVIFVFVSKLLVDSWNWLVMFVGGNTIAAGIFVLIVFIFLVFLFYYKFVEGSVFNFGHKFMGTIISALIFIIIFVIVFFITRD